MYFTSQDYKSIISCLLKILIFTAFNFACILKAFPQGLSTKIEWYDISISSSIDEIITAYGAGDAGFFLQVSRNFAQLENIPVEMYGIFAYWTPGLPIIQVPLIWLNQIFGVPLYISLLIVNMLIWNLVIYFALKLVPSLKLLLLFSVVIGAFIFSFDFYWIFRAGIFFTEGPSYGILLIALFAATHRLINNKETRTFLYVGTLLGLSLLIRHTNEYAIYIGLIFTFAYFGINTLHRQDRVSVKQHNFRIIVFFIIGFLVTLPWRFIRIKFYEQQTWTLSSVSSGFWSGMWQTDSSPIGKYWGSYGVNWACKLNETKCEFLNSLDISTFSNSTLAQSAIISVFKDPLEYIQLRINSAEKFYFYISHSTVSYHNLFPYISIFALFIIIFLLVRIKNSIKWMVLILWLPFILTNLIAYAIAHFENRYFISFRLCILGLMLSLSSLYNLNQRNKIG